MKKNVESPFSPSPSVVPPSKATVDSIRPPAVEADAAAPAVLAPAVPRLAPIDRAALAAKLDGMEIAIGGTVSAAAAKTIGEVSAALKAVVESKP